MNNGVIMLDLMKVIDLIDHDLLKCINVQIICLPHT